MEHNNNQVLEPRANAVGYNNMENNFKNGAYSSQNSLFKSIKKISISLLVLSILTFILFIVAFVVAFGSVATVSTQGVVVAASSIAIVWVFVAIAAIASLVLTIVLLIKVNDAKGKHPEFENVTAYIVLLAIGIFISICGIIVACILIGKSNRALS